MLLNEPILSLTFINDLCCYPRLRPILQLSFTSYLTYVRGEILKDFNEYAPISSIISPDLEQPYKFSNPVTIGSSIPGIGAAISSGGAGVTVGAAAAIPIVTSAPGPSADL